MESASERSSNCPCSIDPIDSTTPAVQNETHEPHPPWSFTGVTWFPFRFRQSTAGAKAGGPALRRAAGDIAFARLALSTTTPNSAFFAASLSSETGFSRAVHRAAPLVIFVRSLAIGSLAIRALASSFELPV